MRYSVSGTVVCLYHVEKLCSCPASNYCLRYRYTLDELPSMLVRLKHRAELYQDWNQKVERALEAPDEDKIGEK